MEKKDKITIIVFIFLIVAIIFVVGVNAYKTRKIPNVDRKIEYIFGYTYDTVLNKGENLFSLAMSLIIDKDIFEYAENLDESVKHYVIDNKNNYLKIKNFSIVTNNLSSSALQEYMNFKNIIYFEDDYYMEDIKINYNNYIGSIIDIESSNNNIVKLKSINYYCENTNYIGILDEEPTCNYTSNETNFEIIYENNTFKITNLNNLLNIIK